MNSGQLTFRPNIFKKALLFGVGSAVATLILLLMLSGTVFAAGGVGDGGTGGGGGTGAEAHYTYRGWGWATYATSGPGPQDGFRNGTSWASVQSTCQSAGASTVYAHIIMDSYGKAKIYNFLYSQVSPSMYAGYYSPGLSVDGGRASTIAWETARDAFNNLGSYGVDTSGYSFGNNVAWFCYDYAPPDNGDCSISLSPASVAPGQSFTATITVRNTGGKNWSVDPANPNRYVLGSWNPMDNSTWGVGRLTIPGDPTIYGQVMFAGATKTITRSFTAPSSPGSYSFSWRILEEGRQTIIGTACNSTLTVGTNSTCSWVNAGPASVYVGGSLSVIIRARNGSGHNWTAASSTGASSGHKVGSESPRDNLTWGARRWLMPTINIGTQADIGITVTAPSSPGTYTLAFAILNEGAHWETMSICTRQVTVDPPPIITCPGQPNPPHYTIYMPRTYNDPDYTGMIAWSAPGPTRHTTETRYSNHEDMSDSYWGGGEVRPDLISQSAGNPGYVRLDYTKYQQEYPYDYNQPRVYYQDTYFTRYYYLGAAYYYPYYEWRYYPDPDGSGPKTGEWRYEFVEWRHGGYYVNSYNGGSATTSNQVDGPVLPINGPPCYREYDSSITMGVPQLNNDRESPTNATMSATINIQFDTNDPDRGRLNMRQASRVNNIPYQFHYQIQRFGAATPTSASGGWILNSNTSTSITAGSNARTATGAGAVNGNTVTVSVEQNASDLRVGDRICWRFTVNEERGHINPPGTRSSVSGMEQAVECSLPVVNWPYLEVFGNDVVSGGSFTGGCTTGAGIRTTAMNRPGQFRGASTQYAVFALGAISGFTSASLRQGAPNPAQAPTGLSFSNMTGPAEGGNYAANDGISCLPNYFASRPDTTQPTASFIAQFNAPNADPNRIEYYEINGNFTHNAAGPGVRDGVRKVFYINGTLNINTDIRYQNTTWNDRNNIPFVLFIARDINIDPGVTQLDGVYVAQPNSGGSGTINTCTTSYAACRNPLVINGAFFAERVNFYRTRGSHRNSAQNEGRIGVNPGVGGNNTCSSPWGSTQGANNVGALGGNTCAAEIFSFSPEIYMSMSQILIPEDSFKLDSYVNLPPNL